jgi:hypothetical protein
VSLFISLYINEMLEIIKKEIFFVRFMLSCVPSAMEYGQISCWPRTKRLATDLLQETRFGYKNCNSNFIEYHIRTIEKRPGITKISLNHRQICGDDC